MAGSVLRVGVTGHRDVDDAAAVAAAVDDTLDRLLADRPGADVEVWSSLAEGADRLVADAVLRRGGRLVAVLPLPVDDYRTDFATAAARRRFDELLARAEWTIVVPSAGATREAAYEAAGRTVVDGCDVLVALWDGRGSRGRGGTAEVVAYARRHGTAVTVVPVDRPDGAPT